MITANSSPHLMLSDLVRGIADTTAFTNQEIFGLCLDSRSVVQGDCFVAVNGAKSNGANFAQAAIAAGAAAVLVEENEIPIATHVPVVCVPQLRRVLGEMASRFFGDPSHHLDVIAVTGTNGKTTITQLCAQALKRIRGDSGYAGTLGYGHIDELQTANNTTPDPITLQRFFRQLCDRHCGSVAIEVSSHAIVQSRVVGTAIKVAVFSNLGHDHLDYHGDLASYAEAKKSLFEYPGIQHAVLNIDDPVGRELLSRRHSKINYWTYGLAAPTGVGAVDRHFRVSDRVADGRNERLTIATPQGEVEIVTSLLGDFNALNLSAALAALMALGINAHDAASGLTELPGVIGRMQRLDPGDDHSPMIVIDYAHTPEGLARVLNVLREKTSGELICVFGCGGERDPTKRPPMGRAAEDGADRVIVTSDNPRGENNDDIAAAILSETRSPKAIEVIHDRGAAIKRAIGRASATDLVLIAGKGHEIFQEVRGTFHSFSDACVARQALQERGA
ncbi:MAG: UDP-N-acetylmuramoyl-L-alanyl-D-glutamate--2,6-diaminopimelate ligase [Gammaproteobacteria bacterium]|jgi:UDP-N-acetylmuramoyl-L-alanyl-D-glutamate--2,6-diaminopimelate ligase